MKDNEIIKALECCSKNKCLSCPAYTDRLCQLTLFDNVFNLINRQKAEIERLQKNIDGLNIFTKNHVKVIRLQAIKEFAERLKEKYGTASCIIIISKNAVDDLVKEMTEVQE